MTLLLLSILGLALGPLLDRTVRRQTAIVALLEGFVAATVLGLVLGHILPEAVEAGGWLCLPVAFLGLIGPQLAEGWREGSELRIHGTVAVLALAGLFLHTLMDGAALAGAHHTPHDAAAAALGIGVVLHRLPVGLTVWWLVRRAAGGKAAAAALIAICTGTLVGFLAGEAVVERLDTVSIALFQAFVSGSLVHVVLHRSLSETLSPPDPRPAGRIGRLNWSGIGALAGIGALLFVPLSGHRVEARLGIAETILNYWMLSAPFLIAGFLALGLAHASGRARFLTGALPEPDRPQPSPTAARLSPAVTSIFSLDILLLSIPLLGVPLALVRILASGLILLAVGFLLTTPSRPPNSDHDHSASPRTARPAWSVLQAGFGQAVDRTAPWLLIGFLTAALLEIFLPPQWISTLPKRADLIGLTLLGAAASLPATAALPIALALLHKGISPGAAIAFLITAPILTRTTSHTLKTALGKTRSRLFTATVTAGALLSGLITNHLPLPLTVPDLPIAPIPIWQNLCALLLALLFILSLLRLGPGGMVAQLGQPHTHDHTHHPH